MTSAAPRPLDLAFPGIAPEVLEAYRNAPAYLVAEILDGTLSLMPRPGARHAKVATRLASALGGFHDPDEGDPGGWLVGPAIHPPTPRAVTSRWRIARQPSGSLQ
jgi:Uma2 family endonuclease